MHGTADPDYWGSNPHLPLPNWVRKYLNKETLCTQMHPHTRHRTLLSKSKKVNDWYENLKAKSDLTADYYLRNLGLWLEWLHEDPESILKLAEGSYAKFKEKVSDQIRLMEKEGKAGSYISTSLKSVSSYLKFNNIIIRLGINIKNENRNLTVENERIPEKSEIAAILRNANPRTKVAISLMAYAGLRPETLGNYTGTDGLRLSDIVDLSVKGKTVDFEIVPCQIVVRPELSKARHRYFTFLGEEGTTYLREYLEQRIRSGESLNRNSPLLLPDKDMSRKEEVNDFAMTIFVSRWLKKAITRAGLDWRPYIFRAYFATALDIAESKGMISHPWRQFFMGHKGDIEARYSTNKNLLPDQINEMREAYKRTLKFLETMGSSSEEEDMNRKLKKQVLLIDGFTEQEIEEKGLLDVEDEELRNIRREKLFGSRNPVEEARGSARKDKLNMMKSKGSLRQKVIQLFAVEAYINEGFELVSDRIPGDKALVRLPEKLS